MDSSTTDSRSRSTRFSPSYRSEALRARLGVADDTLVLSYVGRLAAEKGLDVALEALALVEQARPGQVRFLVVGDGPYEQEVRARAPRGTVLTGKLHGSALSEAFASGDVFLFPSTTDTFGNVILEAQASGLPVIVSDIGGPRDLVSHGIDGLISKGHDAGELTEAIRTLASDSTLRIKMGKAARVRVESRNWTEAFECFWNASPE